MCKESPDTEIVDKRLSKPPNIIFLILDCVRSDHLGCYGYVRNTSPNIDILAEQGVKFNNAISQAPWTFPSVFSLLSGCYPHKLGAWPKKKTGTSLLQMFKLLLPNESIPLLPQILKKSGYSTWGFSSNPYINKNRMLNRGFDEFKYLWKAPAMEIVNYGIEKIRQSEKTGESFFLYLHFMDAHHPLQPPKEYYNLFPVGDGEKNRNIHEGWKFEKYAEQHGEQFDSYREHKISLYDGTIRYIDYEIGHLLTELKHSSHNADTIIVLLADHGEEFWDHAAFEAEHYRTFKGNHGVSHGHTLFQELIKVPLIITFFRSSCKNRSSEFLSGEIKKTIQLVDLVPTLLELAGLLPNADGDGTSLLPMIVKKHKSSCSIDTRLNCCSFSSEASCSGNMNIKIALFEYPYKFIYAFKEANALFNIKEDPYERDNLVNKKKILASEMLEKIYCLKNKEVKEAEEIFLSKEEIEELKALGYVDNGE
jgi:arylsulfatase A-like enzyme